MRIHTHMHAYTHIYIHTHSEIMVERMYEGEFVNPMETKESKDVPVPDAWDYLKAGIYVRGFMYGHKYVSAYWCVKKGRRLLC